MRYALKPGFPLMPYCQNCYHLSVKPVTDDIAAIAKINQPFPKFFQQAVDQAADMRL